MRHVYKSNYEIKDVRAAWKAMNSHTMVRKQSTSALEHVQMYRAQTGKSPSRGVVQERLRGKGQRFIILGLFINYYMYPSFMSTEKIVKSATV